MTFEKVGFMSGSGVLVADLMFFFSFRFSFSLRSGVPKIPRELL